MTKFFEIHSDYKKISEKQITGIINKTLMK